MVPFMQVRANCRVKENPEHLIMGRILADPADDDARLVYADWLMRDDQDVASHTRGELIAVQCAIDRCEREYEPVPARFRERDVELRRANEEEWKLPLRPYMVTGHFKRGFVETVTLPPYAEPTVCLNALRDLTPVRWVSFDAHGLEIDFARQLGALGTSPVMRRIEGLRLPEGIDGLPLLPGAAFVALSQLVHLKWLVLPAHRLSTHDLAGFAEAEFTQLEVLDLSSKNGVDARSAMSLFASPYLAGLKHFGLSSLRRDVGLGRDRSGSEKRADAIARGFAWATHLEQIERLTLPNGLTDEGIRHLVRATHFRELKELRLEAPSLHRGYDVLATEAPMWLDGLMKLEIDRNVVGEPMTGLANAGLARLLRSGRLMKLRYLAIGGDLELTEDVGRAILEGLPNLRFLKLRGKPCFPGTITAELERLTYEG
jgi:uncharacterized protein (TIGR02996 family)